VCIGWTNKGLNTINMHGATTKITKIISAEFCRLLAAVQSTIMYPPVSQLKGYGKLYSTRLSEFNATHICMPINSPSP